MTQSDFDLYFPYVSNVWKYRKHRERKTDGIDVRHIECVWKHNIKEKNLKYSGATAESGIFTDKNRERTIRDHDLCKCTAKVEVLIDGSIVISRLSEGHSHDLDALDQYRRNNGLRKSVEHLIWRGISAADIYAGLSGIGIYVDGPQQLYDAGGKYIQRTDINNWSREFKKQNPDHRRAGFDDGWEQQYEKAWEYLESVDWMVEKVVCQRTDISKASKASKAKSKKDTSHGLVFARPERLQKLRRHGSTLVSMDSTHKMCFLKWYLYTLMVRDSHGSSIPCGHFLADGEDSGILCLALKQFKAWCRRLPHDSALTCIVRECLLTISCIQTTLSYGNLDTSSQTTQQPSNSLSRAPSVVLKPENWPQNTSSALCTPIGRYAEELRILRLWNTFMRLYGTVGQRLDVSSHLLLL